MQPAGWRRFEGVVGDRRRVGRIAHLWVALLAAALVCASPAVAQDPADFGEWQGTGGYPWADAKPLPKTSRGYVFGYAECPPSNRRCKRISVVHEGVRYGILDPWGWPLRECGSYAMWKATSADVDVERVRLTGETSPNDLLEAASYSGERVDHVPAVGSALVFPTFRHVWWVEAVDGDLLTLSDYNGGGGDRPGGYGLRQTTLVDLVDAHNLDDVFFIHYEQPLPAHGVFLRAIPAEHYRGGRPSGPLNSLTRSRSLPGNVYLWSSNRQYRLLLGNDGNLQLYGPDFKRLWHSGTVGRNTYLGLERRGVVLRKGHGKLVRVLWRIKGVERVELRDDGSLVATRAGRLVRVLISATDAA